MVKQMCKWSIWVIVEAKNTVAITRESKFENLTFLPYNFYFLLPKNNYMMLEFIFEEGT